MNRSLSVLAITVGLLVASGCGGSSQSGGKATGVVSCSSNGLPISGITVTIGGVASTTDGNGRYFCERVQPGTQTITASGSSNHRDYSSEVTITEGETVTHDITMIKIGSS